MRNTYRFERRCFQVYKFIYRCVRRSELKSGAPTRVSDRWHQPSELIIDGKPDLPRCSSRDRSEPCGRQWS